MNTYNKNLETGKIELHFEKSLYMGLSEETKRKIKSNFLWSNYAGAWVSRAKGNNTYSAQQIAKELNLTYEGETGEKLSFAQRVENDQERAGSRAERMNERAEKAEQRSEQAYNAAKQIGSFIPMGQPILVGHHSEGRHRRDIARIDSAMSRSCQESDKAKYYEGRAENAEYTASGAKFNDPVYLGNRISETEAKIRELGRYIETATTEERKSQLHERLNEETEKLNFFKEKLSAFGIETKESLKEKKCTHIKRRGTWYPVKSFNGKTVTILNWIGISKATWQTAYNEIQGIKTTSDLFTIYDRDGNEVKPMIKY